MKAFKVITDTSSDLPPSIKEKYDIATVSFHVSFDAKIYYKENVDIMPEEFYNRLSEVNSSPKTSLPSINDYLDEFRVHLKNEQDILCICLSSKLSGSYQSAVNAANIALEEHKDRKIIIIDSMHATASQGLIVIEAAKMRDAKMSIEDAASKLNELKLTARVVFTIDSLTYLQRGGRIGRVAEIAGAIFSIKPIITLDDGELLPHSKVRGKKKALSEVVNIISKTIGEDAKDYEFAFILAEYEEECRFIRESLESALNRKFDLPDFKIGVTIGSHTGPTAVGVAYIKKFDA